ncbi:MAG: Hsp20/alpha crystallin family protein [Bacteroidia bacterium]
MCNRRAYHQHWNVHRGGQFKGYGEHPRKQAWKERFGAMFNTPPANVQEMDDKFELQIFAPGFEKSDFIIALTDQTLRISVEEKAEDNANWKRKEYTPSGFSREFALNETIDKEALEAKYENGVLIVSLPKLDGFETARQDIPVA